MHGRNIAVQHSTNLDTCALTLAKLRHHVVWKNRGFMRCKHARSPAHRYEYQSFCSTDLICLFIGRLLCLGTLWEGTVFGSSFGKQRCRDFEAILRLVSVNIDSDWRLGEFDFGKRV